ncbi:hypothetical protein B9G55_00675 [Saccharibacillus sp. O16]|nr:hypothetical protein B9G55_00675 [Saccharibacillus sp. O16]
MSEAVIKDYLNSHARLEQAIEGLDDARLTWKAAASSWSITEVLGHLADHSIVVSFRIRAVLAGSTERLPAFSQDEWVESQRSNEASAAEILAFFHSQLRYNGQLLHRLAPHEWEKNGINAQGDSVRITDIVRGFAAHVDRHLGQIDRIKAAQAEASRS